MQVDVNHSQPRQRFSRHLAEGAGFDPVRISGMFAPQFAAMGREMSRETIAMAADLTRESQRSKAMALIGSTIGAVFALSLVAAPFLQSLIGLYDYARVSGSQLAGRLFAAGDAQARAELPQFDTGAWSLYQPGIEDSLDRLESRLDPAGEVQALEERLARIEAALERLQGADAVGVSGTEDQPA